MSNYPDKEENKISCHGPKEPLPVSREAKVIHVKLLSILQKLETINVNSCCDSAFTSEFNNYLKLFDSYQKEVLKETEYVPSCKSGCSCCCNHWVEDVNSFEAEIIATYIIKNSPELIPSIIEICKRDSLELENIEQCVSSHPQFSSGDDEGFDSIDMMLSVFYQLKRPCPLLDKNGKCIIYPVRPLTCRIYMSFSTPELCKPEFINESDIPTYLLDVDESASQILDELHFRFVRFEEDTGLRSLLVKYLEANKNLPPYVQL